MLKPRMSVSDSASSAKDSCCSLQVKARQPDSALLGCPCEANWVNKESKKNGILIIMGIRNWTLI